MIDHEPDPHHTATGTWSCYVCKRPLMGTFLRPVIPWKHKPERPRADDVTILPGLGTTE